MILTLTLVLSSVILLWVWVLRHKEWLYYKTSKGKLYLGFLGVAVIATMDVMTSIFYAPGEAFRALHYHAMFFIPLTAVLIAFYSLSMIEVSRILEHYGYAGGGVYNFSYLVFGRNISLIAAASILVDFINTAAISSISAIENIVPLFPEWSSYKIILELSIIWGIALLNSVGIRESVKATFFLFFAVCLILAGVMVIAFFELRLADMQTLSTVTSSMETIYTEVSLPLALEYTVIGIGATILAYSGIESILQTQKYVGSWHTIRNSYFFIMIFVGLTIPIISVMVLLGVERPMDHVDGLVTYFAIQKGGKELGLVVLIAAATTLIFAVNMALVAGVELLEVMAGRFGLTWLMEKNRRNASYRQIVLLSIAFSIIIILTQGKQALVADMYAIGLVATFIINLGALILFRMAQGFEHLKEFRTSIIKNIALFIIFIAVFIYVIEHKESGAYLWASVSFAILFIGIITTKIFNNPEKLQRDIFNTRFDVISSFDVNSMHEFHIVFIRPGENITKHHYNQVAFVTFGLTRLPVGAKMTAKHFILPVETFWGIHTEIQHLLISLREWYPEKRIHIHYNWPKSHWHNRLFTVYLLNRLMKLPSKFRHISFHIDYIGEV